MKKQQLDHPVYLYRLARKMTLRELAEKLHVTIPYLSNIERGVYNCPIWRAKAWEKILEIPWHKIAEYSYENEPSNAGREGMRPRK